MYQSPSFFLGKIKNVTHSLSRTSYYVIGNGCELGNWGFLSSGDVGRLERK